MRKRFLQLVWLGCAVFVATAVLRADDFHFPLKKDSVRFAAIGDMGTGDAAQYETAAEMTKVRAAFPFEFVIMLGDDIYGGHSPKDIERKFEIPYKPLLDAGVQFYASLGNHDSPEERFYKPFNMNGQNYYAYKKGNVRFFVLDSDYVDPKQLTWLQKQLEDAAGSSDWKICYFHHPLYSSGKTHGSSVELRTLLEPLFIKYGVDAVFSGHDHIYERAHPQKGIYYFLEGASGQLRDGDIAKNTGITEKGFDTDRTFMLVEIAGEDLYFETLTRTGMNVDSGTLHKMMHQKSTE